MAPGCMYLPHENVLSMDGVDSLHGMETVGLMHLTILMGQREGNGRSRSIGSRTSEGGGGATAYRSEENHEGTDLEIQGEVSRGKETTVMDEEGNIDAGENLGENQEIPMCPSVNSFPNSQQFKKASSNADFNWELFVEENLLQSVRGL